MVSETTIRPKGQAGVRTDRKISSTYYTRDQYDRLTALAARRKTSRSVLLRLAVDRLLEESGG